MNDQPNHNLYPQKNGPSQPPEGQAQEHKPHTQQPDNDWSGAGGTRAVGAFVTIAMIFGSIMLLIKTCSTETMPPLSNTEQTSSGADILQRRVDEAFSIGDEDAADVAPPTQNTPSPAQALNPEAKQAQKLQSQQELSAQREEQLQRQRDTVPSLLTDNPPAPATLGDY